MLRPHSLHDVDTLSCSGGEADQLGKGWLQSCRGDEDFLICILLDTCMQNTCALSDGC